LDNMRVAVSAGGAWALDGAPSAKTVFVAAIVLASLAAARDSTIALRGCNWESLRKTRNMSDAGWSAFCLLFVGVFQCLLLWTLTLPSVAVPATRGPTAWEATCATAFAACVFAAGALPRRAIACKISMWAWLYAASLPTWGAINAAVAGLALLAAFFAVSPRTAATNAAPRLGSLRPVAALPRRLKSTTTAPLTLPVTIQSAYGLYLSVAGGAVLTVAAQAAGATEQFWPVPGTGAAVVLRSVSGLYISRADGTFATTEQQNAAAQFFMDRTTLLNGCMLRLADASAAPYVSAAAPASGATTAALTTVDLAGASEQFVASPLRIAVRTAGGRYLAAAADKTITTVEAREDAALFRVVPNADGSSCVYADDALVTCNLGTAVLSARKVSGAILLVAPEDDGFTFCAGGMYLTPLPQSVAVGFNATEITATQIFSFEFSA
jgi:hypothetical protein